MAVTLIMVGVGMKPVLNQAVLMKFPSFKTTSYQLPLTSHFQSYSFSLGSKCLICNARRKDKKSAPQLEVEPVLKPGISHEEEDDDDEDGFDHEGVVDEFEEESEDEDVGDSDELFDDEYDQEESELYAGDGAGGGGILLAGTLWDKVALAAAEETLLSFDGDLRIYAFKTLQNSIIRVRIEKVSNRSGSPDMSDIEAFSKAYRERLDEAELARSIPENISLEVSSPGLERVVRIPEDLDRFKDRVMYVKYITSATETGSSTEGEGVFGLISFDLETSYCTWGLADVKVNREKAGKGRPMNKKQREWRLDTPFSSLRIVRLYPVF